MYKSSKSSLNFSKLLSLEWSHHCSKHFKTSVTDFKVLNTPTSPMNFLFLPFFLPVQLDQKHKVEPRLALKTKVPKQRGCERCNHPFSVVRLRGDVGEPFVVNIREQTDRCHLVHVLPAHWQWVDCVSLAEQQKYKSTKVEMSYFQRATSI